MPMRIQSFVLAVTISTLVISPALAQPTIAHGLLHEPMGTATMALDSNGNLLISSIGSSGQDGVSIDLPSGSQGLLMHNTVSGSPPVGAFVGLRLYEQLTGESETQLGALRLTLLPSGECRMTVNYTPVSPTGMILGYLGDQLVFATDQANWNERIISAMPTIFGHSAQSFLKDSPNAWSDTPPLPGGAVFWWETPTNVLIVDGQDTLFDGLVDVICASPASNLWFRNPPTVPSRRIEMRLSEMDRWITAEGVVSDDRTHVALGDATLVDSGNGQLMVSNIGSSGLDGVTAYYGGSTGGMLKFEPMTNSVGGNDFLVWQVNGRNSMGVSASIEVRMDNIQLGGALITPDLSGIGATLYDIELLNGDTVVASHIGELGITIETQVDWPSEFRAGILGDEVNDVLGDDHYDIVSEAPQNMTINCPTHGASLGGIADTIRIVHRDDPNIFTSVDWINVTASGIPTLTLNKTDGMGTTTLAGLQVTTLGQASADHFGFDFGIELQSDLARSDSLVISNIGSSGEDGVSIDLGTLRGAEFKIDRAASLGQPGTMRFTSRGGLGTGAKTLLDMYYCSNGAFTALTPDFSGLGATRYSIHLFNNGVEVIEIPNLLLPTLVMPDPGTMVNRLNPCPFVWWVDVQLDTSGPISVFEDGALMGTFLADQISIEHDVAVVPPIESHTLSLVTTFGEILLQDLAAFHIETTHVATGQAKILGDELNNLVDGLFVLNIGSSGLDGVITDLPDRSNNYLVHEFSPEISGFLLEFYETSATWQLPIARLHSVDNGTQLDLHADFDGLGTTLVDVEVLLDGAVLQSAQLAPGVVALIDLATYVPWVENGIELIDSAPRMSSVFDVPVPITIPGEPTVVGDEIRITAVDAIFPTAVFGTALLQGTGPSDGSAQFIISEINDGIPPCPPDLNGDGLLDFFDVVRFLDLFSAGDFAVDFNDDGLLDFFDVLNFLAAFQEGCP
jgi:hypothetical protein